MCQFETLERLPAQSGGGTFIEMEFWSEKLEGDIFLQPGVVSEANDAHPSLSNSLQNCEAVGNQRPWTKPIPFLSHCGQPDSEIEQNSSGWD